MTRLIIKLTIVALLFSSAEAAVCGILSLTDSHSASIQFADNDSVDEHEEEVFCSHLCHCAHHLAAFPHDETFLTLTSLDYVSCADSDHYSSKYSPPLFRPPIA